MFLTTISVSHAYALSSIALYIPATPQRPNPELKITDPLFRSATASSASLNSFDAPRSIVGASRCRSLGTVEYGFAQAVVPGWNEGRKFALQRTPSRSRGRQTESDLHDRDNAETRSVAIVDVPCTPLLRIVNFLKGQDSGTYHSK